MSAVVKSVSNKPPVERGGTDVTNICVINKESLDSDGCLLY